MELSQHSKAFKCRFECSKCGHKSSAQKEILIILPRERETAVQIASSAQWEQFCEGCQSNVEISLPIIFSVTEMPLPIMVPSGPLSATIKADTEIVKQFFGQVDERVLGEIFGYKEKMGMSIMPRSCLWALCSTDGKERSTIPFLHELGAKRKPEELRELIHTPKFLSFSLTDISWQAMEKCIAASNQGDAWGEENALWKFAKHFIEEIKSRASAPISDPNKSALQEFLVNFMSLRNGASLEGARAAIEKAKAVNTIELSAEKKAQFLGALSTLHSTVFDQTQDLGDLKKSIALQEEILSSPVDVFTGYITLNDLGWKLGILGAHIGDIAPIERGLRLLSQCLELDPHNAEGYDGTIEYNISETFSRLIKLSGASEHADLAISFANQAIGFIDPSHNDFERYRLSLFKALIERHKIDYTVHDIDAALEGVFDIISSTGDTHPQRNTFIEKYCIWSLERYNLNEEKIFLENALNLLQQEYGRDFQPSKLPLSHRLAYFALHASELIRLNDKKAMKKLTLNLKREVQSELSEYHRNEINELIDKLAMAVAQLSSSEAKGSRIIDSLTENNNELEDIESVIAQYQSNFSGKGNGLSEERSSCISSVIDLYRLKLNRAGIHKRERTWNLSKLLEFIFLDDHTIAHLDDIMNEIEYGTLHYQSASDALLELPDSGSLRDEVSRLGDWLIYLFAFIGDQVRLFDVLEREKAIAIRRKYMGKSIRDRISDKLEPNSDVLDTINKERLKLDALRKSDRRSILFYDRRLREAEERVWRLENYHIRREFKTSDIVFQSVDTLSDTSASALVYIYPFKNIQKKTLIFSFQVQKGSDILFSPYASIINDFGYDELRELMIGQVEKVSGMKTNTLTLDLEETVGWLISYTLHTQFSLSGDDTQDLWEHVVENALQVLSVKLFPRLISHLPKFESDVIIVPFGHLSILPLHALQSPDGEYFCDLHRVRYAPSFALVDETDMTEVIQLENKASILGVSGIDPNLNFTFIENDALADRLGKGRSFTMLEASSANRNDLLRALSDADVLALSTHAKADLLGTSEPFFALSSERAKLVSLTREAGYRSTNRAVDDFSAFEKLTLNDVWSDSDFFDRCKIVIATSCETNLVPVMSNSIDEAIGFPAAFLGGGCKVFLGTFWQVNDFVTSLLMWKFYKFVSEGVDFSSALQRSARWLRNLKASAVVSVLNELATSYSGKPRDDVLDAQKYFIAQDPDNFPFKNPVYWAGLAIFGRNAQIVT